MKIDIVKFLNATKRDIVDSERDGKPARVLIATRTYETSMDDLWNALTDIERIPRWFLPISGDLRLGGRYQFEGNAGGEILVCEAPRHLSVTWEFGGGVTWVDVSLSDVPEGTQLKLEHTAHVDERWAEYGPGAVGIGWEMGLYGLANHIVTGGESVTEEGLAWMGSPEGKSFMRQSGEGWYGADVAGGAPEAEARAAADRTIAAYTGE